MPPIAVGYLQGQGILVNGAILNNPADSTVAVDTGPLVAGSYLFAVTGAGSVQHVYDFQIRDATNTITIYSIRRRPAAGNEDFLLGYKTPITGNQRARVVTVGAIVGELQLSIIYGEVG